jgi:hypothetical protein
VRRLAEQGDAAAQVGQSALGTKYALPLEENMEELWIYKRGPLGSTPLSIIEILESGLQTRPDQG